MQGLVNRNPWLSCPSLCFSGPVRGTSNQFTWRWHLRRSGPFTSRPELFPLLRASLAVMGRETRDLRLTWLPAAYVRHPTLPPRAPRQAPQPVTGPGSSCGVTERPDDDKQNPASPCSIGPGSTPGCVAGQRWTTSRLDVGGWWPRVPGTSSHAGVCILPRVPATCFL